MAKQITPIYLEKRKVTPSKIKQLFHVVLLDPRLDNQCEIVVIMWKLNMSQANVAFPYETQWSIRLERKEACFNHKYPRMKCKNGQRSLQKFVINTAICALCTSGKWAIFS